MIDRYARSHTDPADTADHYAAIRDDMGHAAALWPGERDEFLDRYPLRLLRMAELYRDPEGAYRALRDYAGEVRAGRG